MKRYVLPVVFSLAVIALYSFVHIRLFNFDLTQRTRESLFFLRNDPALDTGVLVFDIGVLKPAELPNKIDSLLLIQPAKIGINLCHFEGVPQEILDRYKSNTRIVFANCTDTGPNRLSQIVGENNVVTHFKTDASDYFELQLTKGKPRGHDKEMINFGVRQEYVGNIVPLADTHYWFNPDYLAGKVFLVGYIGDVATDNIVNARTTPFNKRYGNGDVPPDMSDAEISANILRTLKTGEFITEIGQIVRILMLLGICLITVLIITFGKTRWTMLNLVIATLLFIVLTAGGSLLIVLLFGSRYYLNLDELPTILLGTIVITVIINMREDREKEELLDLPLNNEMDS